jgi:LysM repeat protein
LGCHRKPSRIQIARRSAVPALAGVAAVVCMSPQALASTSADDAAATAAQPAVTASAHQHAASLAELTSATTAALPAAFRRAETTAQAAHTAQAAQHKADSPPTSYTVRSGDSLSAIAGHLYGNPDAWPVLYWANHSQIQWADVIQPGQVLKVPAKPAHIPAAPTTLAPAPPAPAPATPAASQTAAAPVRTSAHAETQAPQVSTGYRQSTATHTNATYTGSSSFQRCVIARESGGNSQVMNSTGHYGLYQFSASTWAAYGGNPADFGHASVSEQNQVFANAIAAGGQSNWAPYDGC